MRYIVATEEVVMKALFFGLCGFTLELGTIFAGAYYLGSQPVTSVVIIFFGLAGTILCLIRTEQTAREWLESNLTPDELAAFDKALDEGLRKAAEAQAQIPIVGG